MPGCDADPSVPCSENKWQVKLQNDLLDDSYDFRVLPIPGEKAA